MYTRPLIRSDLSQIAQIAYDAFRDDELYNWLNPGLKQYPQDFRRSQLNSLRMRLVQPGCHGVVVVNDENVVMGYAFFSRATTPDAQGDEAATKWIQDTMFNKLERILLAVENAFPLPPNRACSHTATSLHRTRRAGAYASYAPLRPYWHIDVLGVAPAFQRRGVAGLLVQEVKELARAESLPVVLEASPAAESLYSRCGFKALGEVEKGGVGGMRMVWRQDGEVSS